MIGRDCNKEMLISEWVGHSERATRIEWKEEREGGKEKEGERDQRGECLVCISRKVERGKGGQEGDKKGSTEKGARKEAKRVVLSPFDPEEHANICAAQEIRCPICSIAIIKV
jgi:hypothetical protein